MLGGFDKVIFSFVLLLLTILALPGQFVLKLARILKIGKAVGYLLSGSKTRLLYLENQPAIHAGAKYRVEIVRERLEKNGFHVHVHYPFSEHQYQHYKKKGTHYYHMSGMLVKKFAVILTACSYDIVVVRRELLHHCAYGGLTFEKLLLTAQPNVILDMDDYMPYMRRRGEVEKRGFFNWFNRYVPHKSEKVFGLYRNYTLALGSFADKIKNTLPPHQQEFRFHVFPMCVDYPKVTKDYFHIGQRKKVGWISRSAHFPRMLYLVPILNQVYEEAAFELVVLADKPFEHEALLAPVSNVKWSLETEIEQMLKFDIGIAPILVQADDKNEKGTFKLVQYRLLGLVTIASELPYSRTQVNEGVDGFLAHNEEDWVQKLRFVLRMSSAALQEMGAQAYTSTFRYHHIDSQFTALKNFYLGIGSK